MELVRAIKSQGIGNMDQDIGQERALLSIVSIDQENTRQDSLYTKREKGVLDDYSFAHYTYHNEEEFDADYNGLLISAYLRSLSAMILEKACVYTAQKGMYL